MLVNPSSSSKGRVFFWVILDVMDHVLLQAYLSFVEMMLYHEVYLSMFKVTNILFSFCFNKRLLCSVCTWWFCFPHLTQTCFQNVTVDPRGFALQSLLSWGSYCHAKDAHWWCCWVWRWYPCNRSSGWFLCCNCCQVSE